MAHFTPASRYDGGMLLLTLLACAPTCADDETRVDGACVPYVADTPHDTTAWQPAPGTSWQVQYSGTLDTSLGVEMFDLDLFDTTAADWDALEGSTRICYFSAGSYEDWRPDAADFPDEALGDPLDGWPGEWWLDITNSAVRDIMKARLDYAEERGCDGVDPDNINGYQNPTGLGLTATMQLDYNRFLADEAHDRGLSIGLKNDIDQLVDLEPWFNWALNEECADYQECSGYSVFTTDAGKAVFHVEYVDDWADAQARADEVCGTGPELDTLVKTWDLGAERLACGASQ